MKEKYQYMTIIKEGNTFHTVDTEGNIIPEEAHKLYDVLKKYYKHGWRNVGVKGDFDRTEVSLQREIK